MYRDIDAVAMLIQDLDHLLIAITLGHTDQTTKLTHAMIDMDHEVAYLKLLNLLQREGHLTTAGLVALEVVLMETVEYLVVGKDADAQVVIGKALMKGLVNACKRNFCLFRKDFLQALDLFLAVGEDIDLIAL